MDEPIPRFMDIPVFGRLEMNNAAEAKYIWPFKRIVVGPLFFRLDAKSRHAILLHEAGHCKKFHFEKRILTILSTFWMMVYPVFWYERVLKKQAMQHEFEADAFAAEHGDTQILCDALNKLQSFNRANRDKWEKFMLSALASIKQDYLENESMTKWYHPPVEDRIKRLNEFSNGRNGYPYDVS